jgi:hypothetical protein
MAGAWIKPWELELEKPENLIRLSNMLLELWSQTTSKAIRTTGSVWRQSMPAPPSGVTQALLDLSERLEEKPMTIFDNSIELLDQMVLDGKITMDQRDSVLQPAVDAALRALEKRQPKPAAASVHHDNDQFTELRPGINTPTHVANWLTGDDTPPWRSWMRKQARKFK